MMKRKKGFTLIELLAVIVILALIAIIVVPVVFRTIDDARMGWFKDSAYGIIKAAEFNYSWDLMEKKTPEKVTYTYTNGVETVNPTNRNKLDYKGDKPKSGIVSVNAEGEVALAITDGSHCATKKYADDEVSVEKMGNDGCECDDIEA